MPIPASGNQVSIKDILDEKQEATTAQINVSLKGLSVDGTNDYQNTDITGTPDGDAPYAISEFHGYSQNSMGAMPSIEPATWGGLASSYGLTGQNSIQPEGFASWQATREDSNKRIKITTYSGNHTAFATVYDNYINYTGMNGATFAVKFSWTGGTTGPGGSNGSSDNNPVMAGFNEDQYYSLASNGSYRQFKWISQLATCSPSGNCNGYALQSFFDVVFTVKITLDGVDYTASTTARDGTASARRGIEP